MARTIHPRVLRATVTAIRELESELRYFTYEDIAEQAGYDPRTIARAMQSLCAENNPVVIKERINIPRAGAYWRYSVREGALHVAA
jgi:hypothetical protein